MTPQRPDDQLAIVLGQSQLIAVCCMFLVTMGLVATLAYVSGRTISAAQLVEAQRSSDNATAMVVEPAASPVPTPLHAHAETLPPQALAPQTPPPVHSEPAVHTPPPAPPAPASTGVDAPPLPGSVYWQVGVVDRGIASVFVEHLNRMGLRARTATVQTPGFQRVLVGPLLTQAGIEETKQMLDKAGFQAFLKKY